MTWRMCSSIEDDERGSAREHSGHALEYESTIFVRREATSHETGDDVRSRSLDQALQVVGRATTTIEDVHVAAARLNDLAPCVVVQLRSRASFHAVERAHVVARELLLRAVDDGLAAG